MLFGIINTKFNCYLNSAIQTIIRIPPLMKFYGNEFFRAQQSPLSYLLFNFAVAVSGNTSAELRSNIMPKNKDGNVDLTSFKYDVDKITNNYVNSDIQHDAVEFFNELLAILSKELNELTQEDKIKKFFGLGFKSSTQCNACGKINILEECDLMLKLNLKLSLGECIESFEKPENIEKRCDAIDCSTFNQDTTAIKQTSITRIPECLIIHFKRTPQNKDNSISFPIDQFKMGDFLRNFSDKKDNDEYSLVSVINYEGEFNDNQQGHYFTFSRDQLNGSWWILNDAHRTRIQDIKHLNTKNAILLIYVKTALIPKVQEDKKFRRNQVKIIIICTENKFMINKLFLILESER
jgi:ubiquitin C-terminal hydrolase